MKNAKQILVYFFCVTITSILSQNTSYAITIDPEIWTTETINNANSNVINDDVSLRIYQTSWAIAETNLGNLNGFLTISFNYQTISDGWWEEPIVTLSNRTTTDVVIPTLRGYRGYNSLFFNPSVAGNILATVGTGELSITPYGSYSGSFTSTVPVNDLTILTFALVPSWASDIGDHMNTYFNITNLKIDYVPTPVPEPTTFLLFAAGLAGVAVFGRRRRS